MAEFETEVEQNTGDEIPADMNISEAEVNASAGVTNSTIAEHGENGLHFQEDEEDEGASVRVTFVDNLKSPVIELLIGRDEKQVLLAAHQALLVQSPFFEDACAQFSDSTKTRRIELPGEDLDAMGCFLEYIYTGEYFPQKIAGQRELAKDLTMPGMDETGEQLLKHARVYTLAHKLGMGALKTLAHSKIHCVNSSAKGEIEYARYVYATTPKEDDTIRRPVASFWAHRSHVLRREAEDEFRLMCLEFPQFAFDVLSRILDEKLKKEGGGDKPTTVPGSSRKRQRQSQG